jgi:hypothetical protein
MSPDMLVRRAQQRNISGAHPFVFTIARRCVEQRLRDRTRASFPQWNCESPWLALNRCIAREEWTGPTHSWVVQQR